MPFEPSSFAAGKAAAGGGGGDITVESLSVTENGTTTAPSGKAYSPVVVNVPNSYAAADEGKVVSNGSLVSQTAHAEVTQNGTIDTTLYNSVVVNVPTGPTKIANGTVTGGGATNISIPVGKKMPQTNFILKVWAATGTEFLYDSTYKFADCVFVVLKGYAAYDLTTDGTKNPVGQTSMNVNNEGTITVVNMVPVFFSHQSVRNGGIGITASGTGASNQTIKRDSTGFTITLTQGNISYKFVSGITYNWELLYIGDTPATDIVEVV